jgi:hypothetical protein
VDNFLRLENRHTGEILRMRRVHDAQGQIVLSLDGSLPPRASGPPLHVHFLAHVLWRHRDTQLLSVPPRAIQRIVLPVLLFIGGILGKYRGSSWPGSPESCPGAPLVDANA